MFDERVSWDMLDDSFFMVIDILEELVAYLSGSDNEVVEIHNALCE